MIQSKFRDIFPNFIVKLFSRKKFRINIEISRNYIPIWRNLTVLTDKFPCMIIFTNILHLDSLCIGLCCTQACLHQKGQSFTWPLLLLDVSTLPGLSCNWLYNTLYIHRLKELCSSWTCLHYRGLYLYGMCLHDRDLSFTW